MSMSKERNRELAGATEGGDGNRDSLEFGVSVPYSAFPLPGLLEAAGRLAAAESHAALLHEAVVLPQQEVLLHLCHGVERDADHNEQRRPAEPDSAGLPGDHP